MADEYDFQIDTLKFRGATSDKFPYQRATAPFRKEQFDSAPTVGDQSLTGWWTRGQLSFHKGAGLKYYEVLEGEAVLDRFQDSDAVDVWTPGQASLTPSLADLAVAASSATPGTLSGVAGLFYTTAGGMKFYDGTGTTAITTSNSGTPTDVTSDGRNYLAVNGDRIEKQSSLGVKRTNYVTNPSFETGTTSWTFLNAAIAVDTTKFKYGSQSMKVTPSAGQGFASHTASGLTAGTTYILSAWVYVPTTAGQVAVTPNLSLAATPSGSVATTKEAWVRVSCTFTASATTQDITAIGELASQPFYLDGVMLTEFPCDLDYFDGSTAGATWNGTANASTSTYAGSSAMRTNHVTNPSFETGTTGWSGLGSPSTLSTDTSKFKYGAQSMKVVGTSSLGLGGVQATITGLTVGTTYIQSAWLYVPSSTTGTVTGPGGDVAVKDAWVQSSTTFSATSTSVDFWMPFSGSPSSSSTETFYVDAVMVTEFPFDGDYFDGSTTGASWSGTANASKSTYATDNPAASYALWEHGDAGYEFENIWWAKGRIWAVDNTGRWYTLAPGGGTVHVADALWVSGKTGGEWSLGDSPSAVFIGEAGTIYSLTVDVSGAAIGTTAPVVAAIMPAGEIISSLYHYLGYLIITTNKGVRVAQVQDTQLIYGPLVIEGDFSICDQIGAGGNLVYVVGQPTGHSAGTLCALDLTQEVGPLRPAWAPWKELNNGSPTVAGALIDPSNRLFAWAGNLYGSGSTLATSGEIVTGFHRFGTLDPKSFRVVSVRCGGDGGSISVYQVEADGTETLLGSLSPTDASKDFPFTVTGPTERVALKFTLTRDGTDSTKGPELLGYQIKAMPVPERQRLMRWPLALVDRVRLRTGQKKGVKDKAYADLKTLEALESSQAVVTFTDHRTGETGSAYIDSVEFSSDTPAERNDNGFGGIAYVQLRVLS